MKRNLLSAAIVAAMSVGAAEAVNLHSFAGEVLLAPYYTVRDGQNMYLSVVNTTGDTKAIKVRFLEALNSREVLDFNLYLSPYDVWTAGVMPTEEGAKIITGDQSCTVPGIPTDGVEFRTFAFDGTLKEYPLDGGPIGKDRTREGHIEIIEMGIADVDNPGYWDRNDNGILDSTHIDNIPDDCFSLTENWFYGDWTDGNTSTLPPTGGLFGETAIIDVPKGTEVGVPMTILNDFSAKELHFHPGTLDPNLSHANPPVSIVMTADNKVVSDTWPTGIEAVSAAMMTSTLVQEYTVNPLVEGESAWVISMPTKHYHVDLGLAPLAPFTEAFELGESCDPVSSYIFNREESAVNKDGIDFSPMPDPTLDELCYETNVLNYNDSNIFRSTDVAMKVETPYRNGWNTLSFVGAANKMVGEDYTYRGLPAIGFKSSILFNSNVGIGAAYGTSTEFQYKRDLGPRVKSGE